MIQKLADAIHQGTGCDDVVAYQVAEQLVKEGFILVDRDAKLPETLIDELEYGDATCFDFRWGVSARTKDMLEEGWVKEIKDGK